MKIYDVRGIGASLTGSFSGSFKGLFTGPLDGVAATSSYVEYSNVANKPALVSGSSQVLAFNVFATTGSNQFNGNQSITGSLTVSGQVIAQTLNVQQVTSSIVFSSGSNRFGNNSGNTHSFTGSVNVTGSLSATSIQIAAAGFANPTFFRNTSGTTSSTSNSNVIGFNSVNNIFVSTQNSGGFILGFNNSVQNREYTLPDASGTVALTTNLSSYLPLTGGTLTGALSGTSAVFSGCVGIGSPTPAYKLEVCAPGDSINIIGASSGDVATGFRIGRGASLGAQIYDNPQDNITTINTTGGLNLRTGGSGRLSITSTGISCFSCQVCTPHLVILNNVSIGSSCTSTDGYNTRLRITNIANDTFVFAINNQACRPIMFMYGGNTNNPHGYTAWLDNTSGLQNHSLSHITTESTYFAAQGGRVGIGTTSANTKFEVVGGSQCTPGTNTSSYTMALRDPTSMVCGVGGSILLQGYKTGTAAIGNFAYIAGKKENGTAGNEAGYLALGTFDSAGLAYERAKITSAGTVIFNCNNSYCSNYGYNFLGVCNGTILSGAHVMGNVGIDACATPFWCNGGNFRMEFNWSSGAETNWINHNNCTPFKLLWSADNYANKYCFGYNGNFWASNSVYATTLNAGSVLTVGSIGHYQNYRNTSGCFAIFCASQGAILYVTSMHNNGRSTAIVSYANGVTAGAAISVVNQVTPYGPAALSFGVCANGWVYGYSQYGGPMDFYAISMNSTFAWGF